MKPVTVLGVDEDRRLRLLQLLLVSFPVFGVIYFLGSYFFFPQHLARLVAEVSLLLAFGAVTIFMIRRGWLKSAAWTLTLLIWAIQAAYAWSSSGLAGTGYMGLIGVLVVGVLLLGGRAGVIVLLLNAIYGLLLLANHAGGWQSVIDETAGALNVWIDIQILSFFILVFLILESRISRRTSSKAQSEIAERAKAEEQLKDKVQRLQLLRDLGFAYAQHLNLKTLCERVYASIPQYMEIDRASILVYDAARNALVGDGFVGIYRPDVGPAIAPQPIDSSVSGLCFRSMRPVLINDCTQTDIIPHEWVERLHLKSVLAIPIATKDGPLGVLRIDDTHRTNRFNESDIEFFQMVADQLAVAIENARLFDEQAKTSTALAESEQRYRSLIDNAVHLIAEVTESGRVVFASPSHKKVLGYDPSDLNGRLIKDFIHAEDLDHASAGLRDSNSAVRLRFKHADGMWRWLESSGQRYAPTSGEARFVIVSYDITERIRAEEAKRELEGQLLQSQKLEAVGTLAGGIAHDFNNILAAMFGNIELAMMKYANGQRIDTHLSRLQDGAERARDLVKQILAFSRKQGIDRKPVVLNAVIDDAMHFMQATLPKSIEFAARYSHKNVPILADATQLHQVLVNLCTNASHAIGANSGRIEIVCEQVFLDDREAHQLNDLHAGTYAKITVKDDGCGMDPVTLKRIFEPFFTTKEPGKGTGLGLSMVHGIIRQHEGGITVESEVGRGTTFTIFLPVCLEDGEQAIEGSGVIALGKDQEVLLVDDEPLLLDVLSEMLTTGGYRVSIHSDPETALLDVRSNPKRYEAVVTDFMMPRMTGISFAARLRELQPQVGVILLTGHGEFAELGQHRDPHIDVVLLKPVTRRTLLESLASILAK